MSGQRRTYMTIEHVRDHRVALVETCLRGRPYAEVAADLGIPVRTLRSSVFYAMKTSKLAMDDMGVTP